MRYRPGTFAAVLLPLFVAILLLTANPVAWIGIVSGVLGAIARFSPKSAI